MKVKRIKVAVKSLKDALEEFKLVWEKVEAGEDPEEREVLYFENVRILRSMLTEERIRLLKTVKAYKPSSIHELAKLLGRDFKSVYEDVRLLVSLGLLELESTGRVRKPHVSYDSINIEIPVSG